MNAASTQKRSWLLIAALFILLLVLCATRSLAEPDEGRYGEIGRWMLVSGDWLAPRIDGIPFFHKPPLVYWLEALAIAVFGAREWAVRLVAAGHALVMLVALYLGARTAYGERIARRCVLILGTSLTFLMGGQYVNHDMAVAAWITVAIGCFALHLAGGAPRKIALLGFAACALGVLSKGLIGIVLPGIVLLPWAVWTKRWRRILDLPWPAGLGLVGLFTLPWLALGEWKYPGMAAYEIGVQQFTRYTGSGFNNPHPWWFYLPCLVVLLFPWIFFAGAAVRPTEGRERPAPWRALAWIWAIAIVGFFSVPQSKIIGYVLPAVPPLALLAALGIERLLARDARWISAVRVAAAVAIVGAIGLQVVLARESDRRGASGIALALKCRAAAGDTIYALGEYPYSLPFYLDLPADRRIEVIADWDDARRRHRDDWRTELLDGVPFQPETGAVLRDEGELAAAAARPGRWIVAKRAVAPPGFVPVTSAHRWYLYRSPSTQVRPGC
jgi:4-amino-4-deoxy-L-arabinose transferase-like glycosyltransferase